MKIKVQYISDIHLEFRPNNNAYDFLKPSASILVLAGDTCVCGESAMFDLFKKFIEHFYEKFEHIVFIAGNHEYYSEHYKPEMRLSIEQIHQRFTEYCADKPKLHYLNNSVFQLQVANSVFHFIGTTMWTKIPQDKQEQVTEAMNDYRYIWCGDHTFSPQDATAAHKKAVQFLSRAIKHAEENRATAVVITHHQPFLSDLQTDTTLVYEVDMTKLMKKCVRVWFSGHTHKHVYKKINDTLVLGNPLGYPHQRQVGYVNGQTIEISSIKWPK